QAALAKDVDKAPGATAIDTLRAAERQAQLRAPTPEDAKLVRMPDVQAGPTMKTTADLLKAGIPEPKFAAALEASLMRDVNAAADPREALKEGNALLKQIYNGGNGPLRQREFAELSQEISRRVNEREKYAQPSDPGPNPEAPANRDRAERERL